MNTHNASLSPLLVEHKNGLAILTLNKPKINNAFDDEMISLLIMALDDCSLDDDVKAIQLRGAGKHFSAGADLNWMRSMAQLDYSENQKDASQLARLMSTLYHLEKPTVAIIQGASYGGAVGLIACCDIAIASDNARFCLSEVKLGLAPATIGPFVINAIGARQCRKLFLSAEVFNAQSAKDYQLIHDVVPLDKLDEKVKSTLESILQTGPNASKAAKKLVKDLSLKVDDEQTSMTCQLIADLRVSDEGQEGLGAFFEKRPPNWLNNSQPDLSE